MAASGRAAPSLRGCRHTGTNRRSLIVMGSPLVPSARALRTGQAQSVQWRQGTIIEWNPLTLENVIDVDGELCKNLPVSGVAETAGYAQGDVISLLVIGDKSLAIVGEFVIPGSQAALEALSFLSSRIFTAEVQTFETLAAGNNYTDLTTVGPSVATLIGPSGRALVTVSCAMLFETASTAGTDAGEGVMGYEVSGATNVPASSSAPYRNFCVVRTAGVSQFVFHGSRQSIVNNLNPGVNTFTAKYSTLGAENQTSFSSRSIVVHAL